MLFFPSAVAHQSTGAPVVRDDEDGDEDADEDEEATAGGSLESAVASGAAEDSLTSVVAGGGAAGDDLECHASSLSSLRTKGVGRLFSPPPTNMNPPATTRVTTSMTNV